MSADHIDAPSHESPRPFHREAIEGAFLPGDRLHPPPTEEGVEQTHAGHSSEVVIAGPGAPQVRGAGPRRQTRRSVVPAPPPARAPAGVGARGVRGGGPSCLRHHGCDPKEERTEKAGAIRTALTA